MNRESEEGLEPIAAPGGLCEAAPGNLVVRKGDPCDAGCFILSGESGMFLQQRRAADVMNGGRAAVPDDDARIHFDCPADFRTGIAVLFNIGVTTTRRMAEDDQWPYREAASQYLWV